jgi:hypothetical protein
MKQFISFVGIFAGAAVAFFALLFNPLEPDSLPQTGAEIYDWTPLEFHGVELNEVSLLGLPLKRTGRPFAGEEIEYTNASIIVLRDPDGVATALATRFVTLDNGSDLLGANLAVNTYTNIFWPNRGSLLMHGYENRWSIMRSRMMLATGNAEKDHWLVSTNPRNGNRSGILAGSGAVEGVGGNYSEVLKPNPSGDGTFVGRFSLEPTRK